MEKLKDHLVRASLSILNNTITATAIIKGPLSCSSRKVVCLSECKNFKNSYVVYVKLPLRLNIYKRAHKSFKINKGGTQILFHGHYMQDDHEGKGDKIFEIIDQFTTTAELKKS